MEQADGAQRIAPQAQLVADGRGCHRGRLPFSRCLLSRCRQLKQVDLRKLDRHERTTLHGLIPLLSCRNCQPHPPFARLVRLSQQEWMTPYSPAWMPKRGI
jgi:hypothetical protein